MFQRLSIQFYDNECSTYVLFCLVTVHPLEAFSSNFSNCDDCDFVEDFYRLLNTLSLTLAVIKSQIVTFCLPFLSFKASKHWSLVFSQQFHAHNFYRINFPTEAHQVLWFSEKTRVKNFIAENFHFSLDGLKSKTS